MPQLAKRGKWVFGWSTVSPDGKIYIPPEAYAEYGFQPAENAIIIRGSRRSGGFAIGRPEKLLSSPLASRFIGQTTIGRQGQVQLPPDIGVQPGDRLVVVRGSGLALGFLQRGPVYEEALRHPELITFTVSETFTLRCLVDNNSMDAASLQAEHGVAFTIETPAGHLLFDTGQSGEALAHNAARLGVDLSRIDALAFSHAHYDHTGGLETFLRHSHPGLPLYAHPDLFRERFSLKNNQPRSIGLSVSQADLARRTTLHLSAAPQEILPHVWTIGQITTRIEFEGRSPHHYIQADGGGWVPDPYLDDMALVLKTSAGLVVVCGCCHAGLINTLTHLRQLFTGEIKAIVGGTHLANVEAESLERAIAFLRAVNENYLPDLYLNHCSGEQAMAILAQSFGEKVKPCPAGTVLMFN